MTEKEKNIFENFDKLVPLLSEGQKNYMLGFAEGMMVLKMESNEISKPKQMV